MSKNVVFVTNLYDFNIFITQKRGKSFNTGRTFYLIFVRFYRFFLKLSVNQIGRTIYLIFARFYRCFFKTVRQSVYSNWWIFSPISRCIVHRRWKIEDWPHRKVVVHKAGVHATIAVHIERTARIVRTTGNCPFI